MKQYFDIKHLHVLYLSKTNVTIILLFKILVRIGVNIVYDFYIIFE